MPVPEALVVSAGSSPTDPVTALRLALRGFSPIPRPVKGRERHARSSLLLEDEKILELALATTKGR